MGMAGVLRIVFANAMCEGEEGSVMFYAACSYSKERLTMGYLGSECSFRVGSTIKSTSTHASRCL